MPGKARRVASRQAQLGRRRKRQLKDPEALTLPVPAPAEVDGMQDGAESSAVAAVDVTAPDIAAAATPMRRRAERPSPVAARNSAQTGAAGQLPSRARRERPATYNYIRAEVRRILAMSSAVLAVIIVLGIVL